MRYFNSTRTILLKITAVAAFLMTYAVISASAQNLETREIDLKGCIETPFGEEFIIRTNDEFLRAVRSDASRGDCLKNLEEIDFSQHALLGIELNTGYCRRPLGLKARAVKVDAEKRIDIQIRYVEPTGVCRALSRYDFWMLVPKIPENFAVKFDVESEKNP